MSKPQLHKYITEGEDAYQKRVVAAFFQERQEYADLQEQLKEMGSRRIHRRDLTIVKFAFLTIPTEEFKRLPNCIQYSLIKSDEEIDNINRHLEDIRRHLDETPV